MMKPRKVSFLEVGANSIKVLVESFAVGTLERDMDDLYYFCPYRNNALTLQMPGWLVHALARKMKRLNKRVIAEHAAPLNNN
jgi:hypothetical protein